MKSAVRNIFINALALFIASVLFRGLVIQDTLLSVVIGGALLTLMNLTIKPLLSLITLPFNVLTIGGFSWIISTFILYLLTILVPSIQIVDFSFSGANILGFIIPKFDFTTVSGIIASSFIITFSTGAIKWLIA